MDLIFYYKRKGMSLFLIMLIMFKCAFFIIRLMFVSTNNYFTVEVYVAPISRSITVQISDFETLDWIKT